MIQRNITIQDLSSMLGFFPAAFLGNPLQLLFLEGATPIQNPDAYLRGLDGPALSEERREYLKGPHDLWPFPTMCIDQRPDPWDVSQVLFRDFERAKLVLKTQADIGTDLTNMADPGSVDVVAVMIVDGLSYYDLPRDFSAEPCLVDGPTITEVGYRAVVGTRRSRSGCSLKASEPKLG